jgi:D-3-phosphoglycerate dehydrogenase
MPKPRILIKEDMRNPEFDSEARRSGIVTLAPEHIDSVAEYAVTQWLATLKRVYTLNRNSHGGDYAIICTYEASGTTLGLYGFGRIGQAVARLARPLLGDQGRLLVYDIRDDISKLAETFDAEAVDDPMTLFQESDAISLHVAGDDTIVEYEQLCAMKPHASLINASRGNLVNDEAAHRAVEEERLFYYVVDDPVSGPRERHRNHPRIICTNHNAGSTAQSAIRLEARCIGQVADALQGRTPAHILNTEVLQHQRTIGFLGLQ